MGAFDQHYGPQVSAADQEMLVDSTAEVAKEFLIDYDAKDAAGIRRTTLCEVAMYAATVLKLKADLEEARHGKIPPAGDSGELITRDEVIELCRIAVAGPYRPKYCNDPATFVPHDWVHYAMHLAFERGLARRPRPTTGLRVGDSPAGPRCRECGCTEADCHGCIERTGQPCRWATEAQDLCSACQGRPEVREMAAELVEGTSQGEPTPWERIARVYARELLLLVGERDQLRAQLDRHDRIIMASNAGQVAAFLAEALAAVSVGVLVVTLDREGAFGVGLAGEDGPASIPLRIVTEVTEAAIVRMQDSGEVPALRAGCIHCGKEVAALNDTEAIRQHAGTCAASPAVQRIAQLERDLAELRAGHAASETGPGRG